jgi:NAD(P)-dependent dehydrogenase (short-subunit alcohol dehydrogenase family)
VTASLAAISGQPRGEHYAASKGGLVAMMKALAVELARHGVRANAILPGWVDTAMTERLLRWDKFVDRVLPRVPARRGEPPTTSAVSPSIWRATRARTIPGTRF